MKPLDFSSFTAQPSLCRHIAPLQRRRRATAWLMVLPALAGAVSLMSATAMAQKPAAPHAGAAKSVASPSPAAAPEAAATPAIPAAVASPAVAAAATDPTSQRLLQEGREVLITAYYPKVEAYQKAIGEFDAAGSISAATMKAKEDIAARRQLLKAVDAINDDQINFLKTEPDVLRVELGKVGMSPVKIDQYIAVFSPDKKTDLTLQARVHAKESFQAMGEALDFLEESWGRWSTKNGGKISFKKPADVKKYASISGSIQKAQSEQNAAIRKLQAMSAPVGSPTPGGVASPAPAAATIPGK